MSVIDEIKNKAKANKKTVVLPETTDMRTLTAAAEVISEGIADIILVGKEDEIKAKAAAEGLDLAKASFVDPENCDHLNTYIESLCEARTKLLLHSAKQERAKDCFQKMQKRSCYPTHCSSEQQW